MKSLIPGVTIEAEPIVSSRNIVYRGRDEQGRAVIVKVLGQEYPTAEAMARFRTEFALVTRLKGPGVESVIGLYSWDHTLAMVMEDSGPDLRSILSGQALDLSEFFAMAIAMVEALRFVHSARIIHKDINPSNICWNQSQKDLRIIDFGIAVGFEAEGQTGESALEGSLPYLAPEQSGRMNRQVDYRSDYYSLGITFYEMITGSQPFEAEDTLQWIHQHLTKEAKPVKELRPDCPQALSAIVGKLMRKNADERYQSAFGLLHDLRACRDAWLHGQELSPSFQVGMRDVSEKFAFPQKVYGRDGELNALMTDYEQVSQGQHRQVFILGNPGVGKTALIKDLFRPSLGQRTYFIEGRFESESKDIPFFGLRLALQNLAKVLLLENEDAIQRLRTQCVAALEGQAGSLLAFAPQLELIIGPQNQQEDLDGEVARNHCIYQLIQFFKIVARKSQPIIIFLDNMEWADNPSLELLRQIAGQSDIQSMMIIAAARDQELKSQHPLFQLITECKDLPLVQSLHLEPLPLSAIQELLVDTLLSPTEKVESLATLLMDKTNGNPFFLQSLLKHLHEDGKIIFDQEQGVWSWDVGSLAQLNISDNVIDIILNKLARLSPETQQTLKISACIGARFHERTLLAVQDQLSEEQMRQALLEGLQEGFLIPSESGKTQNTEYRFQHDRIQAALYDLIPESIRIDLHLRIGRFLVQSIAVEADAVMSERLRHLNLARSLIESVEERFHLARLNHQAGLKALQATAYESSKSYLQLARELTGDHGWQRDYELVYQIYFRLCEVLYITGHAEDAQAVYETLKGNCRHALDLARVHDLQARQLILLNRLDDAIDESLVAMRTLGVRLSRKPNPLGIVVLYMKIKRQMTDEFFTHYKSRLKPVDESILLQMKILTSAVLISYQLKLDNLMATCVELATYYSCRYGFAKESASAFVNHAVILTNIFRDATLPPKLCTLADSLSQHFNCKEERPYLIFISSCFTHSLHASFDQCLKMSVEGEKAAMQVGDLQYQIYNRNAMITVRNFVFQLDAETDYIENRIQTAADVNPYWLYYLWCAPAHSLLGLTQAPTRFDSKYMTEEKIYEGTASNPIGVIAYHLFKAMLAVVFEDKELGYHHGVKALPVMKAILGLTEQLMAPYHFLSFSQSYGVLDGARQRTAMRIMRRMHRRIKALARKIPKNLQMVQWLMEAELARIHGERELAARCYDQAIQAAQQASYTAMVALFNDIAGRFYIGTDKPRIAGLYFKEAYFHYDLWGAKAKLTDLKERYEDLLGDRIIKRDAPRTQVARTTMSGTTMGTRNEAGGSELDLMAVVKASEILASEVVLESLLVKLMRTTIQSTGAHNGTLVLKEDEQFYVCAETRDGQESGLMEIPLESFDRIPHSLIQFALRSNEPLVIDDRAARPELLNDPYIAQYQPQSILCVPIVNRARICGVIYVEHMSVQGAFTHDRVKVLSVIASQAAIYISNARLYASLEEKVAHRTRELATKTRDIQVMLQNLMQGIFTIQPDHGIHSEYSAYLEEIFGMKDLAERNALELLFDRADVSQDRRMQVKSVLDLSLQGGSALDFGANEHLLLREIVRKRPDNQDQFLEIDWQAIENESGELDKIMVVVRDMTEIRALKYEAEQQRRELHVLSRLIDAGTSRAERFFSNSHEKFAANRAILQAEPKVSIEGLKLIYRNLHTVKGNARTLGFDEVADAVHHEEEIYSKALADGGLLQNGPELMKSQQSCLESLATYESIFQKTLKSMQSNAEEQDSYRAFYDEVGQILSRSEPNELRMQLVNCHERYGMEVQSQSLINILQGIRESLPGLAQELQKETPKLSVAPCPLRFQSRTADIIGDVMMHCIRNSLDHGIEHPEDRRIKGKSTNGFISIGCEVQPHTGELIIRVHDDGRGLNLWALEEKGRVLQLLMPGADDSAIAQMVFVEGVSTKTGVTTISGRGIGMDAVQGALQSLGGSIAIEFLGPATPDRYRPFCFRMTVPSSCLMGEERQPSAA